MCIYVYIYIYIYIYFWSFISCQYIYRWSFINYQYISIWSLLVANTSIHDTLLATSTSTYDSLFVTSTSTDDPLSVTFWSWWYTTSLPYFWNCYQLHVELCVESWSSCYKLHDDSYHNCQVSTLITLAVSPSLSFPHYFQSTLPQSHSLSALRPPLPRPTFPSLLHHLSSSHPSEV